MSIHIPQAILQDPQRALELEWLDTNGLGGWASSSIIGCNTRSYHGVLVAAIKPPTDRYVMLSRLDESIEINNEILNLSTRDFGDSLFPNGFQFLVNFSQNIYPSWEYQIGNTRIRKSLLCLHKLNSLCIQYELISGDSPLSLYLEPFIAARYYHSCQNSSSTLIKEFEFKDNTLVLETRSDLPSIQIKGPLNNYIHSPCWHNRFFYREEEKRGLGAREDLLCTGKLEIQLRKEIPVTILISCERSSSISAAELFSKELNRRERLHLKTNASAIKKLSLWKNFSLLIFKTSKAGYLRNKESEITAGIQLLKTQLLITSEQFIAQRGTGKTIIAGYHWFTDWGRDTLIALRGICIATGKLDQAQTILKTFCDNVKNGLVPNRFVESCEQAEYNTVDASLWLFIAAYEFHKAGGNREFTKKILFPTLKNIFESYRDGTLYNIYEDSDGLINAGNPHLQLTWMDAKIGDWVVTPRHGKAVEINALWFNALSILRGLAQSFNDRALAKSLEEKAIKTKASFNRVFWNNSLNCLYDVVNTVSADPSIRPNQVFAIGLPFALLEMDKSMAVLKTIKEELLTTRGLRTLSPKDPSYRGIYSGSPYERDSAYHQGTVWPWLLGSYMDALMAFDKENGLAQTKEILFKMHSHLCEAGIGAISEIFDGDAPHTARGTIAQAWSVSEILRVCLQLKI